MLRVAWFRFRATFRARVGGLLAIVILLALLGGISMGAIAGARRNQSAFPAFLASTHPSDLSLPTALFEPPQYPLGYDPALIAKAARFPDVQRVESRVDLDGGPVDAHGHMLREPANFNVGAEGSVNGRYFDQDAVTVIQGRMANPARADEMVVSPGVAKVLAADGVHLGDTVYFDLFSNAQFEDAAANTLLAHPYRRLKERLVGIAVENDAVIEDDTDVPGSEFFLFTPALTRPLLRCCAADTETGFQLRGGSRDVTKAEDELARLLPGRPHDYFVTSSLVAKPERAVKPESIAFGVFGLIAALATLLLVGQVIGRQLRSGGDDRDALRALGASPAMTALDGLVGVGAAVVIGALLAGVVAVGLSQFAPMGAVRRVYPHRGVAFDWTVLGIGAAVLVVALLLIAIALAYRNTPHRIARRSKLIRVRSSAAARLAAGGALPMSASTGIRFALEPGRGKNAVPVRSAILGAALAMIVIVGSLTFGASLNTLVSRPSLYGWNWNYELSGGNGVGAIPPEQAAVLLRNDPSVAAWTGVYFATALVDGQTEPVIGGTPDAPVGPPVLSGHAFDGPDQVVLGAVTLSELHKHVGDSVEIGNAATGMKRLQIVGTATMPAVGPEGDQSHPSMGTGVLLSSELIPASVRNAQGNKPAGPNAIFVRLRAGANAKTALRDLDRIASKLTLPTNYGVAVLPVQHPAEIVNYRSMSNTPVFLGAALAVGAVGALALTLVSSVRRRRRELALLKTLGFTRRQLAAVVAWQSTVAVAIGVVIGVPLGVVVGRELWSVFAREIHAVPAPTAPALSIALVAVGALVLANVVAAIPGRHAARTPTALLLHEE